MQSELPARISTDGRTATWNPALTRAAQVSIEVRMPSGELVLRTTMNSGRARVREPERIERILCDD